MFVVLVVEEQAFSFGWRNRSSLGRRAALGCNSLIIVMFFLLLINGLSSFAIFFGGSMDDVEEDDEPGDDA